MVIPSDSSTQWNLNGHQQLQLPHPDHPEEGHTGIVYKVHLQGDYLVSVSADQTARIWDLRTQRSLHPPLVGHTGSVTTVQFDAAAQSDVVITGGIDGKVMVWRFSTGEVVKTIAKAHDENVLSLHFDQRFLVTGGKDAKIKLWNRHSLNVDDPEAPGFAVKPVGSDRYEEYSLLATFNSRAAVNALKLRDNVLVSGSGDSTISIWSLHTGEILQKINIHKQGIVCLQYNGRFIVSGSSDRSVKIYDVDQKVEVACLSGHANIVRSVQAIFGDRAEVKTIISGSYDGFVRVWEQAPDSREWRTQHQFHIKGFQVHGDVHPDEQANRRVFSIDVDAGRFVCSGQGPMIRVWNLRTKLPTF